MDNQIINTDVVVVGAGGCGLTAALTAAERGAHVLLLERDIQVGGSTSMSAGIFVAAESKLQKRNQERGTTSELVDDIFRLNSGQSNAKLTWALCRISGGLMDWLVDQGVPIEHVPNYKYDGMSHSWIHSPPDRRGSTIVKVLEKAIKAAANIELRLQTKVTRLSSDQGSVTGVKLIDFEGNRQNVRANSVILATSGFGANSEIVSRFIPELSSASYYGTPFAQGDALMWGRELGAALDHMSAYQSHSSIAYPKRMLVTTYLINHGAIQINEAGQRFGNEINTYARHAVAVPRQPGRAVVELFDETILEKTLANYPRFSECQEAGIVKNADSLAEIAEIFGLNSSNLTNTIKQYNEAVAVGIDQFGRTRFGAPLVAPYYGIRVTSALVQTLGGLRVDEQARVLRPDGTAIPGLFAGGGSAVGLAGPSPEGYLAGTGLLAAFGLGRIAGRGAVES